MRLLGEIIIIGALIYIGWEIPFRDRFPATISGVAKSTPVPTGAAQSQPRAQPIARSTSTPSGTWMWDPNRHSALDRPTEKPSKP
jgi:hypothetical protein